MSLGLISEPMKDMSLGKSQENLSEDLSNQKSAGLKSSQNR